jgi:kynurenine 3-monooxygenase
MEANPDKSYKMDGVRAALSQRWLTRWSRQKWLHIWPRGSHFMMALPNREGSFTMTVYLPDDGPVSFSSIRTEVLCAGRHACVPASDTAA